MTKEIMQAVNELETAIAEHKAALANLKKIIGGAK